MNVKFQRLLLGVWGICYSLHASDISVERARIFLKNGSQLTGRLVETDRPSLGLKPYWSAGNFQLPLNEIQYFEQLDVEDRLMREGALLQFQNSDRLQITDLGYDGLHFTGKSAWGEQMTLSRSVVDQLRFFTEKNLSYMGQDSRNRVPGTNRRWRTEGMAWPETFLLEALVEKQAEDMAYQLALFDNPSINRGLLPSRLVLEFSDNMINAAWYVMEKQNRFNVKTVRGKLNEISQTHLIQLYGDFKTQTYILYVNGQKIQSWQTDTAITEAPIDLHPVTFQWNTQTAIEIRYLRLMKWHAAAFAQLQAEKIEEGGDRIFFSNGEMQEGRLLGIDRRGISWALPSDPTPRIFSYDHVLLLQLSQEGGGDASGVKQKATPIRTIGAEDKLQMNSEGMSGGRLRISGWAEEEAAPFSIPLGAVKSFRIPEEKAP